MGWREPGRACVASFHERYATCADIGQSKFTLLKKAKGLVCPPPNLIRGRFFGGLQRSKEPAAREWEAKVGNVLAQAFRAFPDKMSSHQPTSKAV